MKNNQLIKQEEQLITRVGNAISITNKLLQVENGKNSSPKKLTDLQKKVLFLELHEKAKKNGR